MALKTRISKADFDGLNDLLKTEYIADGDGYKLDADYEDVTGLKAKRDELLADLKAKQALLAKYGDLDPDAAKAALDAATKAADEKLKAEGDFETLKKQLAERHQTELEKSKAESTKVLAMLHQERLNNALVAKGVLPERAAYLVSTLLPQTELATTDTGFQLKKIGGIGDAAEFDAMIDGLKAKPETEFFFAASNASGSGASGSGNGGGNQSAQTWTRTQWDAASNQERTAFTQNKGQVTD